MLKDPNHHIPKEFTESIYGVKVYCTYNSEPPTSIIIDAIRLLNSDDHYLSQVLHGIKKIYHKVVSPYTVECKHFTTMLSVIADSETNPFTSDSSPLAPSWNFIAFWRYLDANPTRAIGVPGKAWLNKEVKFLSGQGITNQPELSFAFKAAMP